MRKGETKMVYRMVEDEWSQKMEAIKIHKWRYMLGCREWAVEQKRMGRDGGRKEPRKRKGGKRVVKRYLQTA